MSSSNNLRLILLATLLGVSSVFIGPLEARNFEPEASKPAGSIRPSPQSNPNRYPQPPTTATAPAPAPAPQQPVIPVRQQQAPNKRQPQFQHHFHHHRHQQHQHHHQDYKLVGVCQVPEHLVNSTKCRSSQEAEFSRTALAEFQVELRQSAAEVGSLLSSSLDEFRTFSLDLVVLARDNSLSKLMQWSMSGREQVRRESYLEAVRALFDGMKSHLSSYDQRDSSQLEPSVSGDITQELANFFKRIYLVHLKRLIDLRLASSKQVVSLECLSQNLNWPSQTEQLLRELAPPIGVQFNELSLEQTKLSQSMKQSLEFARTLLSSLSLANEMFHNLTNEASGWMQQPACHQALARMTVCQQCHPDGNQREVSHLAPCENYCLNVIRGCMNDVYELNSFWSEHVAHLSRFKMNMIQMNNIENVMSSLDEKLLSFVARLQQQYNTSAGLNFNLNANYNSNSDQLWPKLAGQCSLQAPGAAAGLRTLGGHQTRPLLVRPAALVLPPSQAAGHGLQQHMALRARQSPTMSLFNRLGTFVHQLQPSDQFFAHWPQRLCQRLRANKQRPGLNATLSHQDCWNGRDFSGYNKQLVEFGQPVTISHPEVPVASAGPVATMVLNFIARLKEIGAQLKGRSSRSPHQLSALYQHHQAPGAELISAQDVAHFIHEQSQDEQEPLNSSSSSSPPSVDTTPGSQPADDEPEESGAEGAAGEEPNDGDEDEEEPDVECQNIDCSDLNMIGQQNGNTNDNNHHSNNNQPLEIANGDFMAPGAESPPSVNVLAQPTVTLRPFMGPSSPGSQPGRLGDPIASSSPLAYGPPAFGTLLFLAMAAILCLPRPH